MSTVKMMIEPWVVRRHGKPKNERERRITLRHFGQQRKNNIRIV